MFTGYNIVDFRFDPTEEQLPILKEIITRVKEVLTGRAYGFVPTQVLGEFSRSVTTEILPLRIYVSEEDFLAVCAISEDYLDSVVPFNVSKMIYDTEEEGIRFDL